MNLSDLERNIEDDHYYYSSFFTEELQYHLQLLIEYRIKLVLKQTVIFHASESQSVETCRILDKKIIKLCLTLKPKEQLPVTFESEGGISSRNEGRVKVKLTNYSCQPMKMYAGSTVGYIVLQPFSTF